MDIELNIFTNCTGIYPNKITILDTYNFFKDFLGDIPIKIWVDPHPNKDKYSDYLSFLKKHFKEVNKTKSLSDGYIKAINSCTHKFSFMLEHDWMFFKDRINHSLEEILFYMDKYKLPCLRFNKRSNKAKGWDHEPEELGDKNFKFCKTNCVSNNPHILNKALYIKNGYYDCINISTGTGGIEKELTRKKNLFGYIYGPLGHPNIISHLDGKVINLK